MALVLARIGLFSGFASVWGLVWHSLAHTASGGDINALMRVLASSILAGLITLVIGVCFAHHSLEL